MRALAIALATAAVASTGCSTRYYLVESHRTLSSTRVDEPEVTNTPLFETVRDDIAVIGLRPPDACADQGIGSGTGQGRVRTEVMRTRCGVEMSSLETALTRAGYEVKAWSVLQERKGEPLLTAAAALGVDVVLQVNALERIDVHRRGNELWERAYFKSTENGERRESISVSADLAAELDRVIAGKEDSLEPGVLVAAIIDASAIWVDSGSVMWFYRGRRVDSVAADPTVEAHVDCEHRPCQEAALRQPRAAGEERRGSARGVSADGPPTDEPQSVFATLFTRLADDLAYRLAGSAN